MKILGSAKVLPVGTFTNAFDDILITEIVGVLEIEGPNDDPCSRRGTAPGLGEKCAEFLVKPIPVHHRCQLHERVGTVDHVFDGGTVNVENFMTLDGFWTHKICKLSTVNVIVACKSYRTKNPQNTEILRVMS